RCHYRVRSFIFFLLNPAQVLNVVQVYCPPESFLHGDQCGESHVARFHRRAARNLNNVGVRFSELQRKIEWLDNEDVHGCLTVSVAPELEDLHILLSNPTRPDSWIGKLCRGNRHARMIANAGERPECTLDVCRYKLDGEIGILGETQIAMCVDCQPADDQYADIFAIKCFKYGGNAGQFHGCTVPSALIHFDGDSLARPPAARRRAST